MKEFLFRPWPWWFSGIGISVVMFLLIFSGKQFSCSSNFRTICAAAGLGKRIKFFDFKWKKQTWNLFFLLGAMIGGYVAHHYLTNENRLFKFGTKKMGENIQSLSMSDPSDSARLNTLK
ncbi:MAG: YeeE/YedE family protein, partial [Ferruginibacter sp.]|nr:YeeE/YedE family protein [Ferruginibacter sp.]